MWHSAKRFTVPVVSVVMLMGVLIFPAAAVAVPTIASPAANPSNIQLSTRTPVLVTATVTNTNEIFSYGQFNIEQLNEDGSVTVLGRLVDDGTRGDKVAGDHVFSVLQNFTVNRTGTVRLRVAGNVVLTSGPKGGGGSTRIVSDVFELFVGTTVSGSGGTVPGTGGTTLTVPPGAIDGTWVAAIDALPPSTTIVAPFNVQGATQQSLVGAVEITFAPPGPQDDPRTPSSPLQISVPVPTGVTDTKFLVTEQVLAPVLGTAGLTPRLRAVAAAAVVGTNIVTQPSPLPGILHSGIYALVTARGSGFVTGTVSDPAGNVGGAIVSSNTYAAIAKTDAAGSYSLFVSGGPFTVSGFDPFRGTTGSTAGSIAVDGSTVTGNILLAPLATPPVSLQGIRNAGFENCTLPGVDATGGLTGTWQFTGNAHAVTQFTTCAPGTSGCSSDPSVSRQITITPREGGCMLDINSGQGTANLSSTAGQRFIIPAGARTLSFEYLFISEEFPEFVGTQFNDIFKATVTINGQPTTCVANGVSGPACQVQVNDFGTAPSTTFPPGVTDVGDCFPNLQDQGDTTCGEVLPWRTGTIDLSAFANDINQSGQVIADLLFTVNDAGDNIYDTHVFVDNIRFGTVWVDAKAVTGANANAARFAKDIRRANDVLSQAGLIVRPRNPGTPTPIGNTALQTIDVSYDETVPATCAVNTTPQQLDGTPQPSETQLTSQSRSQTTSDINAYYTMNSVRFRPDTTHMIGYTVGPDEFCDTININTSAGIILFDESALDIHAGVFPHEMGHLLIAPDNARGPNEHGTTDSLNFMFGINTPANGVMTREQSFHINRPTNYPNAVNKLMLP